MHPDDLEKELRPTLPEAHDVLAAIHLLEWARARGFRIGPVVKVGNVQFGVADIRQANREGIDNPTPTEPATAYEAAGLKIEDIPVPGTD